MFGFLTTAAASIRAPLACPSCSPACSSAFSTLANSSAYVSAAAAIDDAWSTQVQPAAASACAAKRENCAWNGTNSTCDNVPQYTFPTNATYCFHNAIPEWPAFGGLIRQMQAAGNATTGGDVWWQNPAVGRLRISGAAVDVADARDALLPADGVPRRVRPDGDRGRTERRVPRRAARRLLQRRRADLPDSSIVRTALHTRASLPSQCTSSPPT